MAELPYSFHLGSNKNRKASARSNARNNVSGSSSLANNGIQNYQQLSKVNNHDFRKYENDNDYIYQLKGTNDIVSRMKDVSFSSKESYKNMTELENVLEEFKTKKEVEEAVDKVDEQNLITNAVSEELQDFAVVQDFLNSTNDNVASNTTSDIDFDLDSVEEYKA